MRRASASLALCLTAAAIAQTAPTTRTPTCTTAGCHTRELSAKFLHGPTAVSACDICHEYTDPAKHDFKLKREGSQLCNFCHIDKSGAGQAHVHAPFANGECIKCHNAHGGETRALLQRPTTTELCLTCHAQVMEGTHAHKPAADNCTACHSPHASSHERLLSTDRRTLCLSCHADVGTALAGSPHPHKPAEGDCLQCHTPHSSSHDKVLRGAPKDLCISCHETIGTQMQSASHPHGALTDEKSCTNCHTPHASTHQKMLLPDLAAACLTCHDKPIVTAQDRTIPAALEVAVPEFHKHGPIAKGECAPCHEVHGGSHPGLLVKPYPPAFYQPYSDEAYALCFTCHDRGRFSQAGAGGTGFRQGDRNLHAVHVTQPSQGRSCRSCHTVHASRNERMIADTVTFGQWKLPLNYARTPTGGSCAPGCHKPQSYDRDAPAPAASLLAPSK